MRERERERKVYFPSDEIQATKCINKSSLVQLGIKFCTNNYYITIQVSFKQVILRLTMYSKAGTRTELHRLILADLHFWRSFLKALRWDLFTRLKLAGSNINWQRTAISFTIDWNEILGFDCLHRFRILILISEYEQQLVKICSKFSGVRDMRSICSLGPPWLVSRVGWKYQKSQFLLSI